MNNLQIGMFFLLWGGILQIAVVSTVVISVVTDLPLIEDAIIIHPILWTLSIPLLLEGYWRVRNV